MSEVGEIECRCGMFNMLEMFVLDVMLVRNDNMEISARWESLS